MIIVRLQTSGNGKYWQAAWTDHKGGRRTKSIGPIDAIGQRQAERQANTLQAKINANPAAYSNDAGSLASWTARYLSLRAGELAPQTLAIQRRAIDRLIQHFGPDQPLAKIDRAMAATWAAELTGATASRRIYIRCAKVIFSKAVELDMLTINPFSRINGTSPTVDKDWQYLAPADIAKIMEHSDTKWQTMIGLCRWAGLRKGEAQRLTWADIDLDARMIHVRHDGEQTTKKRARDVPMTPQLHDILIARFAEAQPEERNAIGLPANNIDRGMRLIVKRAGMRPWPKIFHTLRKNCETDWLQAHPVMAVCEWLGHDPAVASKHYHKIPQVTIARVTEQSIIDPRDRRIELLEARCRRLIAIARTKTLQ